MGDEESKNNPPKKKRKANSGKSIIDKTEENEENDANEEEEAMDESNSENEKNKKSKKKTKKKAPGAYTLTKLRKILKAVGLANPRFYKELKDKSNKEQISKIKDRLTENDVDFSNLSDKAIKKLKAEAELKKEMAELGIDSSKKEEDEDPYKDGVTLSTRRPRRNIKKVSYRQKKPKYEEEDSENEDGDKENGKKENEKEEEGEDEEESSDQEVYEPPSEEEEDEDYEM